MCYNAKTQTFSSTKHTLMPWRFFLLQLYRLLYACRPVKLKRLQIDTSKTELRYFSAVSSAYNRTDPKLFNKPTNWCRRNCKEW